MSIIETIYSLGEFGTVSIELNEDGSGTVTGSADSVSESEPVTKEDLDGLARWLQEHGYA